MNRDKLADEFCRKFTLDINAESAAEEGFKAGFDAAIALDLPIKFAEWKRKIQFLYMVIYIV